MVKERTAIAVAVEQWLDTYSTDCSEGILQLVNFVLRAAGAPIEVSRQDFVDERTDVIAAIPAEDLESLDDYPLASSKADLKRFRSSYIDFWKKLIVKAQPKKILVDQTFVDQFTFWLTVITSAKARSFRLSGTLAGLQLITGLSKIVKLQRQELDSTKVQLVTERQKSKASPRINILAKKEARIESQLGALEEAVETCFKRYSPD